MRTVTGEDAGKTTSLNEKLEQQLKNADGIKLSSADVAGFTKPSKGEEIRGDVKVAPADINRKDPIMEAGGLAGELVTNLKEDVTRGEAIKQSFNKLVAEGSDAPIVLTDAERYMFVESLVSGERLVLDFSLYNGRIKGSFRARSQEETVAIIRYLNRLRRDGELVDMLEYSSKLRNILLAAQVVSLNDEQYPVLKKPLTRTVNGPDNITEPGWLDQVQVWAERQEGLNAAIYKELQKFEQKYWTMVDGADDQNFLNPEESTSE